jgi:hypothetical protein
MRARIILGILAGTALWAAPLFPADPGVVVAGNIRVLRGEAYLLRAGQRLPLAVGTPVQVRDVLHTGPDGSLGLILQDDTALSLGPSSELALKDFQYQPNEGLFANVLGMVKGTLVYISGRIAKLAPASVRVETPVGIVAVRGTKLLVKIDG